MPIYTFFIMNKNAGMVYAKDFATIKNESEKTFGYPLDIKLDKIGCVKFGARDSIKLGHNLLAVNNQPVYLDKFDNKLKMDDMKGASDLFEYLDNQANYPLQLRFGKPQLNTNDKLVLTGRFFG
jgi:trafficking protein particle complex subunit 4